MSNKPAAAKPVGGLTVGGKPRPMPLTSGTTATGPASSSSSNAAAARLSDTAPPARQPIATKRPGGAIVPASGAPTGATDRSRGVVGLSSTYNGSGGVPPVSKTNVAALPAPPVVASVVPPLQPKKNALVDPKPSLGVAAPPVKAEQRAPPLVSASLAQPGKQPQASVASRRSGNVTRGPEAVPAPAQGRLAVGASPATVWVPNPRPFPDPLPPAVVKLLNGTRLEAPFTTECSKEFPSRGSYCCVRCRTPIAAATAKIPCEQGISGFQHFNVAQCRVGIFTTSADVDDTATVQLHVHCRTCDGFLGILSQDVPGASSGGGVCVSGEVLRVNSACLHFVDSMGGGPSCLLGNYFTQQPREERRSSIERHAAQHGGGGVVGTSTQLDDDDDDDDDLLNDTDFDNLDVIGTDDGADRAVERRKAQSAAWRMHLHHGDSPSGGAAAPKGTPAKQQVAPLAPAAVAPSTAVVTSDMRHSRAAEVVNCHSESESDEASESDDDDDDDSSA